MSMTLPAVSPQSRALVAISDIPPPMRSVIETTAADHKISLSDFFGQYRFEHLVAARRDAARRLHELGYSHHRIAIAMKRDGATIRNYCKTTGRLPRWDAVGIMSRLAPDMADVVTAVASAESVTVEQLLVRWIADRAEGEARHGLSREVAR